MSRVAKRKKNDDGDKSVTLRDSSTGAPVAQLRAGAWLMLGKPPTACVLERITPQGELVVREPEGHHMEERCEVGDKGQYRGIAVEISRIEPWVNSGGIIASPEKLQEIGDNANPGAMPGVVEPKTVAAGGRPYGDRVYLRVIGFTPKAIRGKKAKKAYKRARVKARVAAAASSSQGGGSHEGVPGPTTA